MELAGAEKKIQALYSELSFADRSQMPQFEHLWTRAEATRPAPRLTLALALTTAVVVIASAFSFALWSRYSSIESLNIAPVEVATAALPQIGQLPRSPQPQASHQRRTFHRRPTANPDIAEAALLSSWQSPTQSFLESPSSMTFSSLPQLNQSAKELESFLPKKTN